MLLTPIRTNGSLSVSIGGSTSVSSNATDPDCVWRKRQVCNRRTKRGTRTGTKTIYELWSPVRAVALLVKLELPLRTFQVRVLDSGETDWFRVDLNPEGEKRFCEGTDLGSIPLFRWEPNPHREGLLANLPIGQRSRVADQQGVFLRRQEDGGDYVGFRINTNKTADIDKD